MSGRTRGKGAIFQLYPAADGCVDTTDGSGWLSPVTTSEPYAPVLIVGKRVWLTTRRTIILRSAKVDMASATRLVLTTTVGTLRTLLSRHRRRLGRWRSITDIAQTASL